MHVCVLCACLVCVVAREDVSSPGSGVTDDCELWCGCWKLNLGLLEE